MRNFDDLFAALQRSRFRSRFTLRPTERRYLASHGMAKVLEHAADFIRARLAPAQPENDGKQTPMRNHPAFVAQHATGTCCRGCLQKWHGIERGRAMTEAEQRYAVEVIERWLRGQGVEERAASQDPTLFD